MKIGNDGGIKVNTINKALIKTISIIASICNLQVKSRFLKTSHSIKYDKNAEIKNINMFNQSGDFPIAPLYV
jgi:hypothetical protein